MLANRKLIIIPVFAAQNVRWRMVANKLLVPLAGIEPALLAELDFESSASTNSATGAYRGRLLLVNPRASGITDKRRCRASERLGPGRTLGSRGGCSGRGG